MADLWIPGVPIDVGNWHGYHTCRPEVTCHRTYGAWGGDYSVIKSGGLAHLLIGKEYGQWVQFAPANVVQWHDAVNVGYGIEVTGINEDDFTDWQVACVAYCMPQLEAMIGVPRRYDDGSLEGWVDVNYWNGWHSHNLIIPSSGTQHTNLWKFSDWNRVLAQVAGGSSPSISSEVDMQRPLLAYPGFPGQLFILAEDKDQAVGLRRKGPLSATQISGLAASGSLEFAGGYPVVKTVNADQFTVFA